MVVILIPFAIKASIELKDVLTAKRLARNWLRPPLGSGCTSCPPPCATRNSGSGAVAHPPEARRGPIDAVRRDALLRRPIFIQRWRCDVARAVHVRDLMAHAVL